MRDEELFLASLAIITAGIVIIVLGKSFFRALSSRSQNSISKMNLKSDVDETRLIQEMHHSLSKLEDRIESLETIIMDRERLRKLSDEIEK